MSKPAFIITIDTEEDNAWSRSGHCTTDNAGFLPRFQSLCEAYSLKPTYLVNRAMAASESFVRFAGDALDREAAEAGMHLHAWDTPPEHRLTGDDHRHHPYLVEYPSEVMEAKVEHMTRLLEDRFGAAPRSHRAGRWAMDERYARVLAERGYGVDCSVTPFVSWGAKKGHPEGGGGTDYRRFPSRPYMMDLTDISRPGESELLEVPMTICPGHGAALADALAPWLSRVPRVRGWFGRRYPAPGWLRPNGFNTAAMIALCRNRIRQGYDHVEFMLHSSELMPGGSPVFPDPASIEALYRQLRRLFSFASGRFRGVTLSEYEREFRAADRGRPGVTVAN